MFFLLLFLFIYFLRSNTQKRWKKAMLTNTKITDISIINSFMLPLNSLASTNQITFKIIRVGPCRVSKIILIIWLYFLELFLFLVIHRHQFYTCLLVHWGLSHWCSRAWFCQFYYYFCFLVFTYISVQCFLRIQLLACPP